MPKVNRALVSVSDKTEVVWLSRELEEMGVEVVSTGGTYKMLSKEGINATPVAEVTGFPEMLDGRVKTLHPKVHGGILADRSNPEHMRQLDFQKIPQIDLVVVNLYPFAKTVAREGVTRAEAIEQIDIGGPTMVRAAAKNHAHVAVVVNPARYRSIIEEMRGSGGEISEATCRDLAREAFTHTAEYDSMIKDYLSRETAEAQVDSGLPEVLSPSFNKVSLLRYGENPHQSAALYTEQGAGVTSVSRAPNIGGGQLSFNNILDANSAWSAVIEFDKPAVVIIKHNNPCGVAVADDIATAYKNAFDCDPVSAFGSVIGYNRTVDKATAMAMFENFIEVIAAPGFDADALDVLREKKDLRLLDMGEVPAKVSPGKDYRRIVGGLLVQDYDTGKVERDRMTVVTKELPTEEQWEDLLFAWEVAKHVKSNAIVFAKNKSTVGVGAGQMSRVDSVMIASAKAGERAEGSVMASDAFFPFPDGIEKAAEAGIKAVIQPGGSLKDDEAIATCDRLGLAMVFTGQRHFRH